MRAGKGWPYEGGVREPLLIKWPDVTRPDSICNQPVISTDFYPTLLAMAGLPMRPSQHLDGINLVPALEGGTLAQRPLFWHYPHYSNQGGSPNGAVRQGDYKLIERYEDGGLELYNLKEDIGEHSNLAQEMPEKAAALKSLLHDWRESVNVQMPTPNTDFDPNFKPNKNDH